VLLKEQEENNTGVAIGNRLIKKIEPIVEEEYPFLPHLLLIFVAAFALTLTYGQPHRKDRERNETTPAPCQSSVS